MQVQGLITNVISQLHELQADRFAVDHGYGKALAAALKMLGKTTDNSAHMDLWYSAFYSSHSPLVQRLAAIKSRTTPRNCGQV